VQFLSNQKIPTSVHYPLPIHQQPVMAKLNADMHYSLVHSENAAKQVLSLPFHPYLQEDDIQLVASIMIKAINATAKVS